jgi:hypothetical protein
MSTASDAFRKPIEALIRCGRRLEANAETICTACQYMHRFRRYFDAQPYDLYLMAATALYLSAKVTETHLKLRDVIQVFHQTVHKTSDELKDIKMLQSLKDSIIDCELLLIRMLRFKVDVPLAHRYLNVYLQTLCDWMRDETMAAKLRATSWALLNDYMCVDHRSLDYRPQHIAISVIELALRCLNYKIPHNEEALIPWMEAFDERLKREDIEEVVLQIGALYGGGGGDDGGRECSTSSTGSAGAKYHSPASTDSLSHRKYTPHEIYEYRSQKSSH